MKILSACIACFIAFTSIESAEMMISNLTRNIQASNDLYDSVNVHPGDRLLVQLNKIKHAAPDTFLWYIDGNPVIKTEKPFLEWTVENSPGWKKMIVIAMDKKSKIDGSSFKIFVGSFEAPVVSIEDGVKRPGCPLLVRAQIQPYSYAVVPADAIVEYNWTVEKDGRNIGGYTTNTNELEFVLPLDAGLVDLKVSAVDVESTQSPETIFPIYVRPW